MRSRTRWRLLARPSPTDPPTHFLIFTCVALCGSHAKRCGKTRLHMNLLVFVYIFVLIPIPILVSCHQKLAPQLRNVVLPPPKKTRVLHQLLPLDPDCRGRGMRVYPCIRAAQKVFVLSNYLFARSCLNCCISGLVG